MDLALRRRVVAVPLVALVCGALLSVFLGVYGAKHEPTAQTITTLGFGNLIEMKVWLAVAAGVLGLIQLLGALWMYGRLRVAAPSWVGTTHRCCGYLAVLVSLPVAFHCLWSLGFQSSDARVLGHSLIGCAFYGVFVVKVAGVRSRSGAGWLLPLAGGALFTLLVAVVLTSAGWYLTQIGLPSSSPY